MRLHAVTTTLLFLVCLAFPAFAGAETGDREAAEKQLKEVAEHAKEKISKLKKTSTDTSTTVAVEKSEDEEKDKKPWSVGLSMGHSANTGAFLEHEHLRGYKGSISQSWGLNAGYNFELFGEKLAAKFGWGSSVTLSAANNNGKRFYPGDASFSLSDGSIYKDEFTGIKLSAGLSVSLPLSEESIQQKKWSVGGARLGFSRSFGDLNVSYGLSFTKFFYGSNVPIETKEESEVRDEYIEDKKCVFDRTEFDPYKNRDVNIYECDAGYANPSFSIRNSLSLSYSITEYLGASYSLGISNMRKINNYPERDDETADRAQNDRGGSDSFSTSLGLSYDISGQLKGILDLPFSLSASLGMSAGHGVFRPDQQSVMLPVIWNALGTDYASRSAIPEASGKYVNNAAANYGSFSFGLSGSY